MRRSPTLSIYKPNSNSASFERFLEGDELRVGYGMETKFPGRVNSVKENTLSGIGSPGLVGLAQVTTRVSRVKAFSLSGSCRVSRVKVAGLAKLTDLGQLGWVRLG
jgi:hypothetical protein